MEESRQRIQIHSAGVFDVGKLKEKGSANSFCFSFKEFLKKTPEWGPLEPRKKVKYESSRTVKKDEFGEKLEEFSVRKALGETVKKSLAEIIREYVFKFDGIGNMFCMHSKSYPHFFYTSTMTEYASSVSSRPVTHRPFPVILVVTMDERTASEAAKEFIISKRNRNIRCRVSDLSIESQVPRGPSLLESRRHVVDILVGSAADVSKYIKRVQLEREHEFLRMTMKYCIFLGVENFGRHPNYALLCKGICRDFRYTTASFIFMYNFLEAPRNVMRVKKTCSEMVQGRMFVETEKQGFRDIFVKIEFRLITPAEEVANRVCAALIDSGVEVDFEKIRQTQTPCVQKIKHCLKIIETVQRERSEKNRAERQERKERILIITKDCDTATFVALSLRLPRENTFNVDKLLSSDPIEYKESRNLEFRWADMDVLVIDWQSIQDVNRGTVDTVIMFDPPHKMYFGTVLDIEMQNLVSSNCQNKIKLFILLDQIDDIMLMGQYVQLLEKYNRRAPQWFANLYQSFVRKWYEEKDKFETFEEAYLENDD